MSFRAPGAKRRGEESPVPSRPMHADKERDWHLEIMEIPRLSFGQTRGRPRNDIKSLLSFRAPGAKRRGEESPVPPNANAERQAVELASGDHGDSSAAPRADPGPASE